MSDRASATVTVLNRLGLHARPAMLLVEQAARRACDVRLRKGDQEVDGKSIMQVMMLAATKGSQIEIIATGDGAQQTVDDIARLFTDRFGED